MNSCHSQAGKAWTRRDHLNILADRDLTDWFPLSPLLLKYGRAKIYSLCRMNGSLGKFLENRRKEQRPVSLRAETTVKALAGVNRIAHLPSPSVRETSWWEDMKGFAVGNPGTNKAAHSHVLPFTASHPRYILGTTCFLGLPQVSSTRCGGAYHCLRLKRLEIKIKRFFSLM